MGMFANKVAAAKPSEGTGLYFLAGQYPLVQIDQLKLIKSQDPKKNGAELFIIVCDILESKVADRPSGMRGVAQTLNSNHPSAADDCKRFIWAAFPQFKENNQELDEEGINFLTSVEQPARGTLLALECYVKPPGPNSKAGSQGFTKHIWTPVGASIQAQAAELRAKAGLPPL